MLIAGPAPHASDRMAPLLPSSGDAASVSRAEAKPQLSPRRNEGRGNQALETDGLVSIVGRNEHENAEHNRSAHHDRARSDCTRKFFTRVGEVRTAQAGSLQGTVRSIPESNRLKTHAITPQAFLRVGRMIESSVIEADA